jgi:hypothetical protein
MARVVLPDPVVFQQPRSLPSIPKPRKVLTPSERFKRLGDLRAEAGPWLDMGEKAWIEARNYFGDPKEMKKSPWEKAAYEMRDAEMERVLQELREKFGYDPTGASAPAAGQPPTAAATAPAAPMPATYTPPPATATAGPAATPSPPVVDVRTAQRAHKYQPNLAQYMPPSSPARAWGDTGDEYEGLGVLDPYESRPPYTPPVPGPTRAVWSDREAFGDYVSWAKQAAPASARTARAEAKHRRRAMQDVQYARKVLQSGNAGEARVLAQDIVNTTEVGSPAHSEALRLLQDLSPTAAAPPQPPADSWMQREGKLVEARALIEEGQPAQALQIATQVHDEAPSPEAAAVAAEALAAIPPELKTMHDKVQEQYWRGLARAGVVPQKPQASAQAQAAKLEISDEKAIKEYAEQAAEQIRAKAVPGSVSEEEIKERAEAQARQEFSDYPETVRKVAKASIQRKEKAKQATAPAAPAAPAEAPEPATTWPVMERAQAVPRGESAAQGVTQSLVAVPGAAPGSRVHYAHNAELAARRAVGDREMTLGDKIANPIGYFPRWLYDSLAQDARNGDPEATAVLNKFATNFKKGWVYVGDAPGRPENPKDMAAGTGMHWRQFRDYDPRSIAAKADIPEVEKIRAKVPQQMSWEQYRRTIYPERTMIREEAKQRDLEPITDVVGRVTQAGEMVRPDDPKYLDSYLNMAYPRLEGETEVEYAARLGRVRENIRFETPKMVTADARKEALIRRYRELMGAQKAFKAGQDIPITLPNDPVALEALAGSGLVKDPMQVAEIVEHLKDNVPTLGSLVAGKTDPSLQLRRNVVKTWLDTMGTKGTQLGSDPDRVAKIEAHLLEKRAKAAVAAGQTEEVMRKHRQHIIDVKAAAHDEQRKHEAVQFDRAVTMEKLRQAAERVELSKLELRKGLDDSIKNLKAGRKPGTGRRKPTRLDVLKAKFKGTQNVLDAQLKTAQEGVNRAASAYKKHNAALPVLAAERQMALGALGQTLKAAGAAYDPDTVLTMDPAAREKWLASTKEHAPRLMEAIGRATKFDRQLVQAQQGAAEAEEIIRTAPDRISKIRQDQNLYTRVAAEFDILEMEMERGMYDSPEKEAEAIRALGAQLPGGLGTPVLPGQ